MTIERMNSFIHNKLCAHSIECPVQTKTGILRYRLSFVCNQIFHAKARLYWALIFKSNLHIFKLNNQ